MLGGLNTGGLEHLSLDIFLSKNNTDINFYCVYRYDGELTPKFQETGIPLIKIYPNKLQYISYLKKLRHYILSNHIKIVHAHLEIDAFYAWLALRNTGVKIILTFHGYNFKRDLKYKFISKFASKHSDLNLFVSNALKDYYIKDYNLEPNKNITIYNGVSISKLIDTNSINFREEYKLPQNAILLGMLSNFHGTGKDQFTLCKAMKELDNKNIYLFLVGAFENKDSYKECYEYCQTHNLLSNIIFTGPKQNIADIILNFDCFTFSSNHDTFGLAIVEAMMLKIPTVINDIPPFLEISNNGEYAHVYESKNVSDFLNKLQDTLNNDQKNYVEKAYNWALSNFSIDKHIENLKIIYSNFN